MSIRINNYEKSLLPTYQNHIFHGGSIPSANQQLKQYFGKGLRPEIANRYGSMYKQQRDVSASLFEARRGDMLRGYEATQSLLKSKSSHRYLVTYRFRNLSQIGTDREWKTLTYGMNKLDRYYNVVNDMQEIISKLTMYAKKYDVSQSDEFDMNSIEIVSFVRTQYAKRG